MLKLIDDEQYFVFIDSSSKDESCASHEVGFLFFLPALKARTLSSKLWNTPSQMGSNPNFYLWFGKAYLQLKIRELYFRHCKQTDENVNKLVLGF